MVRDPIDELDPSIRALVVLGGLLLLVALGEATGSQLGIQLRMRMGGVLGNLDTLAGAGLGLAQGILVIWLAGGLLAAGPLPIARRPGAALGGRSNARPGACRRPPRSRAS